MPYGDANGAPQERKPTALGRGGVEVVARERGLASPASVARGDPCAPVWGSGGLSPPVRRGGVASPRPHRTPLLLPRRPAPPTLSQGSVWSDQQLGDEPCDGRSESGRGGSAVVLLCLGESGEQLLRHRKTERSTVHCFTSITSLLVVS